MATGLDMSLDDLIKINKTSNGRRGGAAGGGGGGFKGRGGGRGRGGGPGPARRLPNRAPERAAPYAMTNLQAPAMMWQPGLLADPVGGPLSIETGTKLYISNLDYGVSNEDIKELFSEVGDLKRYSIHYDKSGRSKGTAEVVFSRQSDALAAVRRYNNVQLDGKPMKIEIVGNNMVSPGILPVPPPVNGAFGFPNGVPRSSGRGRDIAGGRSFGGRGSVRGRGRGRGRGHNEKFSAEDLDAELVKYHTEATQTN